MQFNRAFRVAALRVVLAAPVVVLLSSVLLPCASYAQQQQRVVQGKVLGPNEEPKAGAVVYIKDLKTLSIKSFISTQDGGYHFGQLADSADYEVWAELDGKKSPTRGVSSFDQKKIYTINLKLAK
jgi:hypothetical protein